MKSYQLVVVGAGPAGMCAALEASKAGVQVLLVDENRQPGGQMFKQIHKFFGSHSHYAGVRGIDIGRRLRTELEQSKVELWLDCSVLGIENEHMLWLCHHETQTERIYAQCIILATGATENALAFPGWDLPGVMTAGAAQTMVNVSRVLPGRNFVMVGAGNVGVIVSYQLLQAGANVKAIVEASPALSGYGVHTAKVRRAGVPFYVSHTVKRAIGTRCVEAVELVRIDERFRPIDGTEMLVEADAVCVAVGFTPLVELAAAAGCSLTYCRPFGGYLPAHNALMRTSMPHIFVAGDIAGVEEASTAMEEGKLAGIGAAAYLGVLKDGRVSASDIQSRLDTLRSGEFGQVRQALKQALVEEGA